MTGNRRNDEEQGPEGESWISFPFFYLCVDCCYPLLVEDGSEMTARPEDSAQPQHESPDQIGMYLVLAEARIR